MAWVSAAVVPTEPLAPGQVRLRVHGPRQDSEDVSAAVFAEKLGALVKALRAADYAVNGHVRHDYRIAKLSSSTPTAVLSEWSIPIRQKTTRNNIAVSSGIAGFNSCVEAITQGDRMRALRYGRCATYVSKLSRGSKRRFGYAEVWTERDNIIRIDPFLNERAQAVISPPTEAPPIQKPEWFAGSTFGSFDGVVLEVDLRGALPEITLVLSAGGEEIDCVCRAEDIEKIRNALNHRVQVFGRAIYDGKSGLPRRLEVTDIQPISGVGDLTVWKGELEPFEPSIWESDE